MTSTSAADHWRTKLIQARWPWNTRPVRPADINDGLAEVLLAAENQLEDAYYHKIAPNRFIIEVSPDNFASNYDAIQHQVVRQWGEKLMERLATANSRLGRKEYHFGGPVHIEIRAAPDLQLNQARLRWQVQAEHTPPTHTSFQASIPCLELAPGRRRWNLQTGQVTIGRYDICDIHLDWPDVQEQRLISGIHAYLRCEADGRCSLYDGSPGGKPSSNGTYVNYQRLLPEGKVLRNGDLITLAAPLPDQPQPGLPGTASFYFYEDCSG